MKKTLSLLRRWATVVLALLMLVGCADINQAPDSTILIEDTPEPITYMPIDEYVDLTKNFSASSRDVFSADTEKYSITCANEQGEAYNQSDASITITPNTKNLIINCTWNPQDRTVYIGLQNTETGIFYILPSTGGSVSGKIKLDDMPEGEYHVVICSNDNPSIVTVLWYQLA